MSIRKKITATPEEQLDNNLLAELGVLSETLSSLVDISDDKAEPALIARLIDMPAEHWVNFSQQHNLQSWFVIPLRSDAAKAVHSLAYIMEQLAFQRDHDATTGLANRRYFERYLRLEMERAERTKAALSLVMIDLDHFKHINDTYGHPCGDKVLQKLGAFLKRSQRSYDLAVRYGGEEFMLVLPGLTIWKAKTMAERLLKKFSEMDFVCDDHAPFHMTFSGGVAGVSAESGYHTTPEELIKQVDDSLYVAKRQGRNRIVMTKEVTELHTATMVMAEEKQFLFRKLE